MKSLSILVFVCVVCYIYAETCKNADGCGHTFCSAALAGHAHVECKDSHCTCSEEQKPCLLVSDCNHGRCIDHLGVRTQWHCVDGNCTCIRV